MAASNYAIDRVTKPHATEPSIRSREWLCVVAGALALVWMNAYICHDLLWNPTSKMNAMHGFWIALAKQGIRPWLEPTWWPYWDCGMPFQVTYAPLVPVLTSLWATVARSSHVMAFQSITAVVYCLTPVTLFLAAWRLTRAASYTFLAALLFSLTAPTQLVVPDGAFSWNSFWDARRLYVMGVWDETPHSTALALLPLAILFLAASFRHRRLVYYIAAIIVIALMASSSEFGMMDALIATLCLLFALPTEDRFGNLAIAAIVGACAYALVAPFFPPTVFGSIGTAAQTGEPASQLRSLTAVALVILGWVILAQLLPRWTSDWRLRFLAFFTYLTASIPALALYLHRQFLPQPERYRMELELAVALLLVFALRPWFERAPLPLKLAILLVILTFAGEQIASHRRFARFTFPARDVTSTIEYRTARWTERNLAGTRVMLPGSIAKWANSFTSVWQFAGSSWSKAPNPVQQRGLAAVENGGGTPQEDARISLAWLRAYGVSAIAMSGPASQETWKPYAHPTKFEGVLPVLWREDDVAVYRVPQRTASLAHVIPSSAIVRHSPRSVAETGEIDTYGRALDDRQYPAAAIEWEGPNRFFVRANASEGQVLSIQVSYHPGWHAHVSGRVIPVRSDGLGLMWLDPHCNGPCEVQFDYDGGWELRLARYLSYTALTTLVFVPLAIRLKRR